jgi:uncharacterized protein YjiS (DUF1127 family)
MQKLISAIRSRRARKLTYRYLTEFDEHLLNDIGLNRNELEQLRYGRRL